MSEPTPKPEHPVPDTATVGEAREWLRENVEKGAECPLCHQFSKVYRRTITSAMARALALIWHEGGWGKHLYVHVPSIDPARGGDVAKLENWGLIEEERIARPDGGRAGYWRITNKGEEWLNGKVSVPKYARLYDGKLLSLTGPSWDVFQALGKRFDYRDLMDGSDDKRVVRAK
jgi:hypothetical protein